MKKFLDHNLWEIYYNPLDLSISILPSDERGKLENRYSISITRGPNCAIYPFKVIFTSSGEEYFTKQSAMENIKDIFNSALEFGENIFNSEDNTISKNEYVKKNGRVLEQTYIDILLEEINSTLNSLTYEWE